MKLSHSKLSCILSCPMSYYLTYIEGISTIQEKPALYVGSAVHWGIEHNTEDLSEYFNSQESEYTRDQLLAESMVHGYLKHKDEIFRQILSMPDGSPLNLLEESHEVYITGKLPSNKFPEPTDFVGIIDLLLLTDKGFVVIDYKTSSYEPDWSTYLEQIYRYIFLLRSEFPDIPVVKIGIVNIKKTSIRQKKTENYEQFLNRLKYEYDINDENLVNYHEYQASDLNKELVDSYINNLSKMCDAARIIDENKSWFINYGAANGTYGKSPFWNIFYHTEDAYLLYKISDEIYDEDTNNVLTSRECVPIDMLVIDKNNVLNHYSKYRDEYEKVKSMCMTVDEFHRYLKTKYICDDNLLKKYFRNLSKIKTT